MTHEQWERVKDECHNAKMVAFAGLSVEAQKAMREACESMGSPIDWVNCDGSWEPIHISSFYYGNAYRINPSWPGPSKPKPVVEYEDVPVVNLNFRILYDGRFLHSAQSDSRFAGYVMPDGRIRSRLIFDSRPDRTYRLRVPKAVRLVKDVEK